MARAWVSLIFLSLFASQVEAKKPVDPLETILLVFGILGALYRINRWWNKSLYKFVV